MRIFLGYLLEKQHLLFKKIIYHLTHLLYIRWIACIDFVVTYSCNSKCLLCDIWKCENKKFKDLPMNIFKSILEESCLRGLMSINFTGGEPFLRKDLYELYNLAKIKYPFRYVIISTNGLLTENIMNFLDKIKKKNKLGLVISMDGIEDYEKLRGIKGGFNKVNRTIDEIKEKYLWVRLTVKFTISPWNYDSILNVYNYSKEKQIDFIIKIVENIQEYTTPFRHRINKNRFYFNKSKKRAIIKQLKILRKDQLKRLKFKEATFTNNIMEYLSNKNYILPDCMSRFYSVFIMQNGNVYTCREFKPIGNIYNANLKEMWKSKIAKNICYSECSNCCSHYGFYTSLI